MRNTKDPTADAVRMSCSKGTMGPNALSGEQIKQGIGIQLREQGGGQWKKKKKQVRR